MTEEKIFEQLEQIAKWQPVFAGDLIHKQAKDELVKRKWVMYYEDPEMIHTNELGYKNKGGGYVLTELGSNIYGAKLVAKKTALSGIGGVPDV